jgi:hypothetical protein
MFGKQYEATCHFRLFCKQRCFRIDAGKFFQRFILGKKVLGILFVCIDEFEDGNQVPIFADKLFINRLIAVRTANILS